MNEGEQIAHRVERAVFETDRQLVVGDVTLPPEGYQSRFSDVAQPRATSTSLPLTNVEITSLVDGRVSERPFIVLCQAADPDRLPVSRRLAGAAGGLRRGRRARSRLA